MADAYEVSQKIIVSGRFLEHYTYSKPYWVGWPVERVFRPAKPARFVTACEQTQIRDDNVRRTRIKIRRLVNSNPDLVKFMTLTFNTDMISLEEANKLFNIFIKKITRLSPGFKYLAVPEFQSKSKRVHYHLLCNLPYVENSHLTKLWGNGFVFIRKVDSVENMGSYVSKYLGKGNFDKRYFRKRKFFYSLNLIRPVIIDDLKAVLNILDNLPSSPLLVKRVFSTSFFTDFLGVIYYNQYKLSEFLKVAGTENITF